MEEERKQVLEMFRMFGEIYPSDTTPRKPFKHTDFKKCSSDSNLYREQGNKVFREEQHDAQTHLDIYRLYSYSIATAPKDSEELALGYYNRSALLLHLRKYDECMLDIDRALKVTQMSELKAKLFCRKSECQVALQDGKKSASFAKAKYWSEQVKNSKDKKALIEIIKRTEKILGYNEQDFKFKRKKKFDIDCDNSAVEINHNEKYGRHLIAARNIKPGEFVCVDKFYVASANGNKNYAYCHHCTAITWASVPCDHCAYAMYCSEDCKREAWVKYHDVECTAKISVYSFEEYVLQMSVRALIMGYREAGSLKNLKKMIDDVLNCTDQKAKGCSEDGELVNNSFKSIIGLTYLKEFDENRRKCAMSALVALGLNKSKNGKMFKLDHSKKYLDQKNAIFNATVLLRLISIFMANGFSALEDSFKCRRSYHITFCVLKVCCSRGLMCSPLPSLFNHSCDNNVSRFYTNDGRVVYYANQPIKKGAQMYVSYYVNYMKDTRSERQEFLRKMYEMSCECQACKKNWLGQKRMMYKIPGGKSTQAMYIMMKYEDFFKNFGDKNLRHSRKFIDAFANDLETIMLKENKPSFYIQFFVTAFVEMMNQRYGTTFRVPSRCRTKMEKIN